MGVIFAVAVGGALGALGRYFMSSYITKLLGSGFPYGIFAANLLGCFLMGIAATLIAGKLAVSPEMRALLTVGFLGAFTTFSTYALDIVTLYDRGQLMSVVVYALGSMILGVTALLAGMMIAKGWT